MDTTSTISQWIAAVAALREHLPGIELALHTASFTESLRLLANGKSNLHSGVSTSANPCLPTYLRREPLLDLTAGIGGGEGHALLDDNPGPRQRSNYPWIDFAPPAGPALYREETGKRVTMVLWASATGLFLMTAGPGHCLFDQNNQNYRFAIWGASAMKTLTVKDAKYSFGRLIDLARAEPVTVAKHRRPVVMVVEDFQRLKALDRRPRSTTGENGIRANDY